MSSTPDCFFSRSLEIYQSQIHSLNRLYNIHYSLFNSVNSNLILLTQQHNNYYNGFNTNENTNMNNTNMNNTNMNNTNMNNANMNNANMNYANMNNTNMNNTNMNNTNMNNTTQLPRTSWNYSTNQNNTTSFNNILSSQTHPRWYNNTYIPTPPPSVLRPLNQNNIPSRPINPPPSTFPYTSTRRSGNQSPLLSRPANPEPSLLTSWQENRSRRRNQYNFTQNNTRPVLWVGNNNDPSNNSLYDLSRSHLRSFRNNTRRRRRWGRRPSGRFVPFFWERTGQNTISELLNQSLYDQQPRNSLSNNLFNTNTTTDTWANIQTQFESPRNNICPITRERFSPNNRITRINYCGHLFNNESLIEWFRYDTRCPICRYDLTTTNNDLSNNLSNNLSNDLSNNISNPFNSNLDNWIDPSFSMFDLSQNIHSVSNQIVNNIMNVLENMDISSNLLTAAAELTFNFPNNQIPNDMTWNINPQNTNMDENAEEEIVENIVDNILNNMENSINAEENTEDENNLLEEKYDN